VSTGTPTFTWPELDANIPLDATRSWTARFDSYDQHHERCFYLVRIFDRHKWIAELMAEIPMDWAGDNWTVPEFAIELQRRIAEVAATGKTNTSYGS
jgi:hypothetical protein